LNRRWAAGATATTTPWLKTNNGLYKAGLIHRHAPWKSSQVLELATLEWVDGFNHNRLHSLTGYIPPAQAEANTYNQPGKPATSAVLL